MRLWITATLVAVLALAVPARAASPPDPLLRAYGKPFQAGYIVANGIRWYCQTWVFPRQGFSVRRCYFVSRVTARPQPPGS